MKKHNTKKINPSSVKQDKRKTSCLKLQWIVKKDFKNNYYFKVANYSAETSHFLMSLHWFLK